MYNIFENLDSRFDKEKEFIKRRKLYEAYKELEAKTGSDAYFLMATVLLLLGKYDKAIFYMNKIDINNLRLEKSDVYYEVFGVLYYFQENYLDASGCFLKSIEINPDNFYSLYNMSNIYMMKNSYVKALEILRRLDKIKENDESIKKNIKLLEEKLN